MFVPKAVAKQRLWLCDLLASTIISHLMGGRTHTCPCKYTLNHNHTHFILSRLLTITQGKFAKPGVPHNRSQH
ncbi:hypothetical protein EV702DRAFT_1087438 [Suillus placidus]|uniref:Uncharacterized protein n=1 Tax=Suillus placidus TaxID=48579 RepID=A0A9P6ZYU4_9AGAM|nr:hypothetical protein EV702DRAFT_1087438 [Suillus placidus]